MGGQHEIADLIRRYSPPKDQCALLEFFRLLPAEYITRFSLALATLIKDETVMTKHVIIDIDNVIANTAWREPLIAAKGWDEFHSQSVNDDPVHAVKQLLYGLQVAKFNIILCTGRPERYRQDTMNWLLRHGIWLDELLMRPNDDFRKSPQMKVALVQERFKDPKKEVAFIVDDRLDIIEAFNGIGIPGFQAFVVNVRASDEL